MKKVKIHKDPTSLLERLREASRPLAFVLAAWIAVCLVHQSSIRSSIENYSSRYLEFYARKRVGGAPIPSPRLKVLSFDDQTFSWYRDSDLSREDWAILIKAITDAGASHIVIDKIFGLAPKEPLAVDMLRDVLQSGAPVIAGSFHTPNDIKGREPMPLRSSKVRIAGADWLKEKPERRYYGPEAGLVQHFAQVGHITYAGNNYVEPVLNLGNGGAVAYSGLLVADKVEARENGLFADDVKIPLDREHRLLINLADFDKLKNFSLKAFIALARKGKSLQVIEKGDVVVILPQMYTGNTDFKDTPAGELAGGLLLTSVVNSTMTKNYFRYVDAGIGGLLVVALIAGFLGLSLSAIRFGALIVFGSAALAAVGLGLFVKFGIVSDWLFVVGIFNLTCGGTYLYKSRRHEKTARRAREALSGLVPEARLAEIIANPALVRFEPSEKVLTLMFIDIVGFSTVAETKTPQQVFGDLKEAIGRITRKVHEFDGFVDRTLGDGLLCYFGYSQGRGDVMAKMNHAEQAISCALSIQQESIELTLASQGGDKPVFPLRIGINTAGVFLGDLGDGRRLDYTVIGHGVNFSQRLEASCEPYRVMISGTTYALATNLAFRQELIKKRLIQIKHHRESFEVYELIPTDDPHKFLMEAQSVFNKSIGMNRMDQRWQVPDHVTIEITTEYGVGRIVNYSKSGFSLLMPSYLARGFQSTFMFENQRTGHHIQIGSIHGEIRWGRPLGNEFLHGILIKNLSEIEIEVLLHQLHALCRAKKRLETMDVPAS